jgi:purine-binding chemotaxis protein CheW
MSYIIFSLNDLQYGIETNVIKEVFLLPEITPIDNAPQDIIGVLNLRSQIVPIMDLNLRFGRNLKPCDITNEIIAIQWQNWQVGLIVDRILGVREIPSRSIELDTSYGRERNIADVFIKGTIEVDNSLVMLLDSEALIRQPEAFDRLKITEGEASSATDLVTEITESTNTPKGNFYDCYFPDVTELEKDLLQQRAINLKTALVEENFGEQLPVAVVRFGREYYGFTLDVVQEFIKLREVYPIPSCPENLLGNTNWRGDIVTLINLANTLKIDRDKARHETDVVMVKIEDIVTGFPVDEVLDIRYLPFAQINSNNNSGDEAFGKYLLGTSFYENKPMTVLDIGKIITQQL